MQYNKDNFYKDTQADFVSCDVPTREPDYYSNSDSRYWYTDEGVYRLSDHFGWGVGSCNWTLDGCGYGYGMHTYFDFEEGCNKTDERRVYQWHENDYVCGFCPWASFTEKRKII